MGKQINRAGADARLREALKVLPEKPSLSALQEEKKRYSERVSEVAAYAIAEELRKRGLAGTRPAPPGVLDSSGAERRMSGGLGAKKVDVTWASEASGLLLGVSIKSINFRDKKTNNFQKNLVNRRGDMLFESVTLHRRFPYAVLIGVFFLDEGAESDATDKRSATFENARTLFAIFTGRNDPAGREEQFERLYIALLNADKKPPRADFYAVGEELVHITLEDLLTDAIELVCERNSDFYQSLDGQLVTTETASRRRKKSKKGSEPNGPMGA